MYTVTEMTGEEYIEMPDALPSASSADMERCIRAIKGSDESQIFLFAAIEIASTEKEFVSMKWRLSGQNNEIVYFATKQAGKDSKL